MRRLIDLTIGVHDKSCKVQVGRGAKQDMRMWLNFLEDYNGVSVFLPATHIDNFELELFTDAAGSIGMGAYFKGHWTQLRWPTKILRLNLSIAFLGLYPIVVSVILWGSEMTNRKILFRSDNQAVVSVINKQTSKCSRVMSLVRILVLQCLMHNIVFSAKHIPGVDNSIADALSRFQGSTVPLLSSRRRQGRDTVPTLNVGCLEIEGRKLLRSAKAPKTTRTYEGAMKCFEEFRLMHGIDDQFPIASSNISLFIAFLSIRGYAASTVATYISAIGYYHKVNGFIDPTDNFVIREMIEGFRRKGPKCKDIRPAYHFANVASDLGEFRQRMFIPVWVFGI